jgi:putative DNA primase/helicase
MLRGTRMVLQSETEQGDALDTGMLKRATEDVIKTRPAYGQPIEFELTHKMWLDTNYEPKIRELDKGTWRRIKLIHHVFEIPAADRDLRIEDKFWDERDGVFAWLVEGAKMYYKQGLDYFEPACVKAAVANYKAESDILAEFADECVVRVDPTKYGKFKSIVFTSGQDLRQAYLAWANNRGVIPVADTTLRSYFLKEMKLIHGHNTQKSKRGFKWCLVREQTDAKRSTDLRHVARTSHKLNGRQKEIINHIDNGGPIPLAESELIERAAERCEIAEARKHASGT